MNKSRLEAFSDGVIAIIITIMVLEMKVPHGSGWNDLRPLIPTFISYLMSFVNIGIYWMNHHHIMHAVNKTTSGFMLANLSLLFWLSLIPFTTAWMGENNFATNTVALYSVSMLMPAVSYGILQRIIIKNHLYRDVFDTAHRKQMVKGMISLGCYILSSLVAFIAPIISGIVIAMVALMWLIPDKNIESIIKNESSSDN